MLGLLVANAIYILIFYMLIMKLYAANYAIIWLDSFSANTFIVIYGAWKIKEVKMWRLYSGSNETPWHVVGLSVVAA
jgi:hypothetical protein